MTEYSKIKNIVCEDFKNLQNYICSALKKEKTALTADLSAYINSGSKQLRACQIFLFSRLLYGKTDENSLKLACAVEIIHNATLIHDDIIDGSEKRRGKCTLNKKYDNRLAIIAGDFLLSSAIKQLCEIGCPKIIDNFSDCLIKLCKGEIDQYFSKNSTPSLEQYLDKSASKTASLFISALKSLADINNDATNCETLAKFAEHYGKAFQLRDDLNNLLDESSQKPLFSDISNGIYTAPVIFTFGENKDLSNISAEKIIEKSRNTEAITKTEELIAAEIQKAKTELSKLAENEYTQAIRNLCNLATKD